ncbi:ribonuclease P protein component [Aurantimonas sp. MSK8Z-1]|uniref:ribonuclease P protein component n=1 Tax=Mangrovibrevibacter kandeliae TaxID=2968473 RepID=UPI00211905D8|nr:ribonuclease P protein component [Aurantimonas sp. MSK8Z-1]MCW4116431.1 ribonuclease P protein component [Aurantimonas sp. MSK8Z-1]
MTAAAPRPAVERIRKRADFLAARAGRRLNGPFFFVETRDRADGAPPRVGFTVTKKVGNAVERNRIRRRLREAIRLGCRADMLCGFDYVIVARRDLLHLPFATLTSELSRRFGRMSGAAQPRPKREVPGEPSPGTT